MFPTRCAGSMRAMHRRTIRLGAGAAVVAVLALTGCSESAEEPAAQAPVCDPSEDPSCPASPELTVSPEDSIALAEDDKGVSPPEEFQIAQTLKLTDSGPVPLTLVVIQNRELRIRNETDQEQTLHFVNAQVDDTGATTLGPIAAGAELVYTPTVPISMAYNLDGSDQVTARLQVDTGAFDG